jgi:hypothetical protein
MALQEKKQRSNISKSTNSVNNSTNSVGAARRRLQEEKKRDAYRMPPRPSTLTTPVVAPSYSPAEIGRRESLKQRAIRQQHTRRVWLGVGLVVGFFLIGFVYLAPGAIYSSTLQKTEFAQKEMRGLERENTLLEQQERFLQHAMMQNIKSGALKMEQTPINSERRRIRIYTE